MATRWGASLLSDKLFTARSKRVASKKENDDGKLRAERPEVT